MSARPDSTESGELVGEPRASVDTRIESNAESESLSESTSPGETRPTLIIDERAQADNIGGVILGIGIAVVIGFVVLYIANEVMMMTEISAGGENESADPLYPAYEALQLATNNTFELFGLLFLVVVLSIAIVYLWRAQGNR